MSTLSQAQRYHARAAKQAVTALVVPSGTIANVQQPGGVEIQPTTMVKSRIKYIPHKGKTDVNDWLEQYIATSAVNEEADDDTKKRMFQGLIKGEALKCNVALDLVTRQSCHC